MSGKLAIQIHPADNVVTVVDNVSAGQRVRYVTSDGCQEVEAVGHVPFGHKVAVRDIGAGQPVIKYNQPIGTASRPIRRGEHVHVHNVQSAVQGAGR